jgi:hypothetical protein
LIDEILHDKTLQRLDEKTQRELDNTVRELIVLRGKSDEEIARFARKPQELECEKQDTLNSMVQALYDSQKPVEQRFRPFAQLLADEEVRRRVSRRVANELLPIMDELFVLFETPERSETWTLEFERRLLSELQRIADEEIITTVGSGGLTTDQRTQQIGDRAVSRQPPQSGVPGAPVQGEEIRHAPVSIIERIRSSKKKALTVVIEMFKAEHPGESDTRTILKGVDGMIKGITSEGERNKVWKAVHDSVPSGWKVRIGTQPTVVAYWDKSDPQERGPIKTYVSGVKVVQ